MEDSAEGDDDLNLQWSESGDSDDSRGEGRDMDEGSNNQESDSDDDEEEQQFDITLPTTHSYMGPGLVAVSGREVLEAGWVGAVAVLAHHGAVFPGETVPLLLPRADDAQALAQAVRDKRMFGLLCPDSTGALASGYGVLCEVYEAGGGGAGGAGGAGDRSLCVKARAVHRFRFARPPRRPLPLHHYTGMRTEQVVVLPELGAAPPLRHARLSSLDQLRRPQLTEALRRLEAALTPWPAFLYDMFEYARLRDAVQDYFHTLRLDKVPEEPTALSFWVASNLALSAGDRLALLKADSALKRLHLALKFINKRCMLCCASCLTEIARREHIFAMSSDGVHSNYTNLGGFMHDVVTVSRADNIVLDGGASAEYSWFPGYTWTIALCRACAQHVGWRFDAMKRKLRPQQFFGLCRNQVQPAGEGDHRDLSFRLSAPAEGDPDPALGVAPPPRPSPFSQMLQAELAAARHERRRAAEHSTRRDF